MSRSDALRGNRNAVRKLTDADALMIRQLHAEGRAEIERIHATCSIRALADKFEVHPATIEKVLNYSTFKGVA